MMKIPKLSSIFRKETKKERIEPTFSITETEQHAAESAGEMVAYGDDISGLSISSLLGQENNPARTRHQIFKSFMLMEKDPVVSIALKTHAIAALGGHESKGDVIFIEEEPDCSEEDKKFIAELKEDLLDNFNKIAFTMAYNAIAFGDSYCRTYFEKGKGLVRCIADEMVHPSLILPYEQGGETSGFIIGTNKHNLGRMTTLQLARMKMPRVAYIPQMGVVSKTYRNNIMEDDVSRLPQLPSMIGGSFLFAAEKPFWDFYVSLNALVGQRLVDSIDEAFISVNMNGSTKEQQKKMAENLKRVLSNSKVIADKAMQGVPQISRIRHVMFTHNEKQFTTHGDTLGSKRQGSITIDDVLLHAKLLSGSLGIDLSMLGFAEQLSGGLGEGGFFRASAQIAESSRLIRIALSDFFNEIIDNHCLFKYGKKLNKATRPFNINFYGSISAFENERQQTRATAVGSAGLITQTLAGARELGLGEEELVIFMSKQMAIDEEEARIYAKSMASNVSSNEMMP